MMIGTGIFITVCFGMTLIVLCSVSYSLGVHYGLGLKTPHELDVAPKLPEATISPTDPGAAEE